MSSPIKRSFGWRRQQPDFRDLKYRVPREHQLFLPASIDLDSPSPGAPWDPGLDQGDLGSCGPNALAEEIAFGTIKSGASRNLASRLFLYYNTRLLMGTVNQDSGVDNRTMLKALKQYGWCEESLWPYDINAFTHKPSAAAYQAASLNAGSILYEAVDQVLETMKSVLAGGDTFLFGFTVYNSMLTSAVDASGDIPMPSRRDGVAGGHDIEICGYDDSTQRFKLKNSWGTSWGKNGYGTIPYAYATNANLAGDFWRVTQEMPAPPAPPPGPPPGPPSPPSPGTVLLTLSESLAAGEYFVMPQTTVAKLKAAGLTPTQIMQIFAAVAAFLADKPITAPKMLNLLMTIAAILGTPMISQKDFQLIQKCQAYITTAGNN